MVRWSASGNWYWANSEEATQRKSRTRLARTGLPSISVAAYRARMTW